MSNFLNKSTINGDITININKRLRSPTPESDSGISVCEVKRRGKLEYLVGEGLKRFRPSVEWVVNVCNITKDLKKFRKKSIRAAENGEQLNDLRFLALSNIFPPAIGAYMESEKAEALDGYIKKTKAEIEFYNSEAIFFCSHIVNGQDDIDFKTDHQMTRDVRHLVSAWCSHRATAATSEASFTEKHLMMYIRKILLEHATEDVIYAVIDKPLPNVKKPDFMLGYRKGRKDTFFFLLK